MNTHGADNKDAARMLLDAFEEIRGGKCHPEDELEAQRFAQLPLAPEVIISRMRAVAQRNGVGWRPSRLRYFANPINDLVQEQPTTKLPQPAESEPLSSEEHEQSLAALQALETPEQKRRVELVGTLEPRATLPELIRLLHDRIDDAEFSTRLEKARQRRQRAVARNPVGTNAAKRAS